MSDQPLPSESDPMPIDPSNLGSIDPLSVEGIFLVALGKQGDERAEFLDTHCTSDQRPRVEAMLAAYEQAGDFLEQPAHIAKPTSMTEYFSTSSLPGVLGKLGPYEILDELGRGGMGVVFKAHDPQLQRIVAVKILSPELARLPTARQRFLREARAAAAISHPHVVTIFAVDGTEEASLGTERVTLPYLVMECIVGQTLQDKIQRVGMLKTEEIVRISRQIAEGLTAAHQRGLIHRDIKPANILLENGVERVKITDFGLARTTSDAGITHTGEILGTPQCMSPEQARGELVDQRSDLFSLGCVMYTMCTGVSPFRADNMLAVMKKVCETEPRPVAQLNPNVPEWLCALVHQLLQKEPSRRVQSAQQVVDVLESRVAPAHRAVHRNDSTSPASQPTEREIPAWLLTSVLPKWTQTLPPYVLDAGVLSLIVGFMCSSNSNVPDEAIVIGGVFWGLCALFKLITGTGRWINWSVAATSIAALFLGGIGGMELQREFSHHVHGIIFVFGSAIGIFWLLTRWFPRLFMQTRSPQPVSSAPSVAESSQSFERAAARPRSPWSFLGWMLVGLMLLIGVGGGLAVIALIIPAYQARQTPKKVVSSEFAGRFEAVLAMENDTSRHNTLVRLAEDAANAGDGDLVLKVIEHVEAGTARSNTCAICSEALLKRGMTSAATAVALQIENETSRNNMLARIASTPISISAVPSPTERVLDPSIHTGKVGTSAEAMPKDRLDPILAKLQGAWDMHMQEADPNPSGGKEEALIEGDLMTITITLDGKLVTIPVQLKLDGSPELHETLLDGKPVLVPRPQKTAPAGSPRPIDLIHFPNDKQERQVLPGIIEFRNDSVRICLANSSKGERPEVFAVGKDADVWELRRKPAVTELEVD